MHLDPKLKLQQEQAITRVKKFEGDQQRVEWSILYTNYRNNKLTEVDILVLNAMSEARKSTNGGPSEVSQEDVPTTSSASNSSFEIYQLKLNKQDQPKLKEFSGWLAAYKDRQAAIIEDLKNNAIEERDKTIEERDKTIKERDKTTKDRDKTIKERNKDIREIEYLSVKHDEKIKKHNDHIGKYDEQIKKYSEQVKEHDEQVKEHDEQMKKHDEQVKKYDEYVKKYDEYVKNESEEAKAYDKKIEKLFEMIYELKKEKLGPGHPDVIGTLEEWADYKLKRYRFKEAEELYKRACDTQEGVLGPMHLDTAMGWQRLGEMQQIQGNDSAAKESFLKAFVARKAALGIEDPNTIKTLGSLVEVHQKLKDFQGIKNFLSENGEKVLLEKAPATQKTADFLNRQGKVYLEQRDLNRAEKMFYHEVFVRAKAEELGPRHLTLVEPYSYLAFINQVKAEDTLQKADDKLQKLQESLESNKIEEGYLRSALDILKDYSKDGDDLEKWLDECLKKGKEIKLDKFAADAAKLENPKDLANWLSKAQNDPDLAAKPELISRMLWLKLSKQEESVNHETPPSASREHEFNPEPTSIGSSSHFPTKLNETDDQRSVKDPLSLEVSNKPQDVTDTPRSGLERSHDRGKSVIREEDSSSSHSADDQKPEVHSEPVAPTETLPSLSQENASPSSPPDTIKQPKDKESTLEALIRSDSQQTRTEHVPPSEMSPSANQGSEQRRKNRLFSLFRAIISVSKRKKPSQPNWEQSVVPSDAASPSHRSRTKSLGREPSQTGTIENKALKDAKKESL